MNMVSDTKVVAMIPVMLGSTRVPDKNLVIVDGRVLCSYTIDACKQAGVFAEIYLNSENQIFADIAAKTDTQFYQRKPEFGGSACTQSTPSRTCCGTRCVINEHYLYDFISNTPCDYFCQVNSTSPLLRPETIVNFVNEISQRGCDSMFAVSEIKAESFFDQTPINFNHARKVPSQELKPIHSICWAIAGWRRDAFLASYANITPDCISPVFIERRNLFPINEIEALDIDEWPTLFIVEELLKQRRRSDRRQVSYYDGRTAIVQESA